MTATRPQCRDCKHYLFIGSEFGYPANICKHPNIAYTGDLTSTEKARSIPECGIDGRGFEPKPPKPPSLWKRIFKF